MASDADRAKDGTGRLARGLRRTLFSLWVLIVSGFFCFSFLGCAQQPNETGGQSPTELEATTTVVPEGESKSAFDSENDAGQEEAVSKENEGMSLKEAKSRKNTILVKRGDLFYRFDECKIDGLDKDFGRLNMAIQSAEHEAIGIPVVDLTSGDQLVMMNNCYYGFWEATDPGDYICPEELGNSYGLDSGYLGYEEVDGKSISQEGPEDEAILAEKGAYYTDEYDGDGSGYIAGPKGTSFTLGYYYGTDFLEKTITIDTKYYTYVDKMKRPEQVKTREGYFLLDASELEPGLYLAYIDGSYAKPDFLVEIR